MTIGLSCYHHGCLWDTDLQLKSCQFTTKECLHSALIGAWIGQITKATHSMVSKRSPRSQTISEGVHEAHRSYTPPESPSDSSLMETRIATLRQNRNQEHLRPQSILIPLSSPGIKGKQLQLARQNSFSWKQTGLHNVEHITMRDYA